MCVVVVVMGAVVCHSQRCENTSWVSLVVQWLRICLAMQGTWVQSLVQKDPMCHGATKGTCSNYGACLP